MRLNPRVKVFSIWFATVIVCLFVIIITFFHFKYEEIPYKDVYIQELEPDLYEVAFKYRAIVYGNMHGPSLPFSKNSDLDEVDWLYLRVGSGNITSDDIIFTHFRHCRDPLYWQKALKGTIEISGNKATFALEMPDYVDSNGRNSDTIQRYVDWRDNGQYNLVSGIPPDLLAPAQRYRPASCDDISQIRPSYRSAKWNPL
jgi:hypothetical protein